MLIVMSEESILKKVIRHKKNEIRSIIVFTVILWVFIFLISPIFFSINYNFINTLLSIEGTLFSIITAAYIFYAEFLDKEFTRTFKTRNDLFELFGDDEIRKNELKKGLFAQFLNLVFLQYILAFALLVICLSLIFSISVLVSFQGTYTGIVGVTNLCLFFTGIVFIISWLLMIGFGNLPGKESLKALIED